MNKLVTKQLKVNLQEIENVLNRHEEYEEEFWIYKLALKKNNIIINIFDDEWIQETLTLEVIEEKIEIKNICKSIINYLYENEINSRQNYINKSKSFNNRKIKSMSLWMGKGKLDKVSKINMDLVERYNTNIEIINTLATYKSYLSDFYSVLNELYPNWKVEDISIYVADKFEYFNIGYVQITIQNNKIIANYNDNIFSVTIDNFSKKDDVFRELHNKVKTIQDVA